MKRYILLTLIALLCFVAACSGSGNNAPASTPAPEPQVDNNVPDIITGTIEMEGGGKITFELYPDIAPQSVRNFVELARNGFYDGSNFHRIISGMMIQGGCPLGQGTGNPGYSIVGEFSANGFENSLKHTRGVLSTARGTDFDSAGSQFFIMHDIYPSLDGNYASFGMVTSGMDVVDRIAEIPNSGPNGAVEPGDRPVIKSITIDGDFTMAGPDKLSR